MQSLFYTCVCANGIARRQHVCYTFSTRFLSSSGAWLRKMRPMSSSSRRRRSSAATSLLVILCVVSRGMSVEDGGGQGRRKGEVCDDAVCVDVESGTGGETKVRGSFLGGETQTCSVVIIRHVHTCPGWIDERTYIDTHTFIPTLQ